MGRLSNGAAIRKKTSRGNVSVQLDGPYDDVVNVLGDSTTSFQPELGAVIDDLQIVLETINRIDGRTRSKIASDLSDTMTADVAADQIERTLDRLREQSQTTVAEIDEIEREIDALEEERRELQNTADRREHLEDRPTDVGE